MDKEYPQENIDEVLKTIDAGYGRKTENILAQAYRSEKARREAMESVGVDQSNKIDALEAELRAARVDNQGDFK